MIDTGRRILMARVHGAFGVHGELKVESFSEPPQALLRYAPLTLRDPRGNERELEGVGGRAATKGLVMTIPGIEDRDAAEALRGAEIYVPRSALPPPAPGEYYWVDLEGMEVVTTEGVALGRVSHLTSTGVNDVLVVEGERERLIPFKEPDYVTSVDFDTRRITVDWDPDF
ncbi:ribosome maturation factor RimM [Solilutibacter silvestris]|uniref:Ribosome maturation factor RimM n=1 Tax=Solilutibacter silvestris TaxID=1645665 RepID=A0A2K1PY60_9GAMM|nr:ribosome maturation factor RimM [Lysobacter silvestris]PNS07720.1 16S rRNA processing protein RimM [Lysobacter silvestris]